MRLSQNVKTASSPLFNIEAFALNEVAMVSEFVEIALEKEQLLDKEDILFEVTVGCSEVSAQDDPPSTEEPTHSLAEIDNCPKQWETYIDVDGDEVIVVEANSTELAELLQNNQGNLCIFNDDNIDYKCTNCLQIFLPNDFENHICEYDEQHRLIGTFTSTAECVPKSFPPRSPLSVAPPNAAVTLAASEVSMTLETLAIADVRDGDDLGYSRCMRQLKENNILIRRFLKDQFQIDLRIASRKQDGPHDCTMCDRKFVHASGLMRHMEKHALDLIPVTTTDSGGGGVGGAGDTSASAHGHNTNRLSHNGKKLLHKSAAALCLTCGRVFATVSAVNKHISESHDHRATPNSDNDGYDDAEDGDGNDDTGDENNETDNDSLSDCHNSVTTQGDVSVEKALVEKAIENLSAISEDVACGKSANIDTELPCNYGFRPIMIDFVLQCELCDYLFCTKRPLLWHTSSHDPTTGFECKACNIAVATAKEITMHWQTECHAMRDETKSTLLLPRYYMCNVCENRFGTLDALYDHRFANVHLFPRLSDNGSARIGCEICGAIHDTARSLLAHRVEWHAKKIRSLKEPSLKTRQYLCDVCGKSYTQSSHLWQHLRFHRGVKPFACKEVGCNRKFTIRPDLNDHIRKCHTGERPYHCAVCGKRFLTGSVYYQHRLIHRGERRYGCTECGKRFYRADALKNHQRIHTGEKPYSCDYCVKFFRQRGDRDKHIRARHNSLLDLNKKIGNPKALGGRMAALIPATSAKQWDTNDNNHNDNANDNNNNNANGNDNDNDTNKVVYVGDIAFPSSMFQPIMNDIDAVGATNE